MNKKLSVIIKNDLSEIQRLSKTVEEFGKINNLSSKTIFDTNLSLDELLTNIISYGYDDNKEHKIFIQIWVEDNELNIEIIDDGQAFNPLTIPEPDLDKSIDERPIGGLGFHLVKKLMERVEYKRKQNKNILLLTKLMDS